MLPLDHVLSNRFLHTIAHESRRIDQDILQLQDLLCGSLKGCGFLCHFRATDGETGLSSIHKRTFEKYEKLDDTVSLPDVVKERAHPGRSVEWPVSDFLHSMTNSCAMIAKGSLAFGANDPVITTKQLTKKLDSMNIGTVFEARDLSYDEDAVPRSNFSCSLQDSEAVSTDRKTIRDLRVVGFPYQEENIMEQNHVRKSLQPLYCSLLGNWRR
jgi:hypothetical protein